MAGKWIRGWKLISSNPKKYKHVWIDGSANAKRARSLAAAKKDLGYEENPAGSNRQKYGEHWDENGVPWCGLAVAYWWQKGGFVVSNSLAQQIGYVPTLVSLAAQKKHGLALVHRKRVKSGDAVAFDFDGGVADHVGLFSHWIDKGAGVFASVEGNTSVSSNDNGGKVMTRTRYISQVAAFVRKMPPG